MKPPIDAEPEPEGGLSVDAGLLVPNRPDVIDEVFDGEAVLVNLRTGCYYALNPSASEIWALLGSAARSAEELAREVSLRYQLDPESADAVERFVARLRAEELVVARCGVGPQPGTPSPATTRGAGFAIPEITRFDDMQDLLLLDPIHDLALDGDGWPVPRVEPRSE